MHSFPPSLNNCHLQLLIQTAVPTLLLIPYQPQLPRALPLSPMGVDGDNASELLDSETQQVSWQHRWKPIFNSDSKQKLTEHPPPKAV